MNQPVRKRSLLSYSLRALLIFMLVVALLSIWVGRRVERAHEQRAILTEIEAAGWHVSFDNDVWEEPNWWNLLFDPNLLDHVVGVRYFSRSKETEEIDLAPLAQLKNLESLAVRNTQVSDLSPLAELKNLVELNVADTQVSDLSPLAQLKNLEVLYVYGTQVSDVAPLAELKNLQALFIMETQVSDLTPLAELKNLKWLLISDTLVSDLSPLAQLKNLEGIAVSSTQVSDQQVEQLQNALPNCEIER